VSVSSRELVMSSSTDKKSKSSNEGTTWAEYRPSSGSTYYIHKVTREKVYEKPLELASPSEKI
jgi:DNA relaxase NicK